MENLTTTSIQEIDLTSLTEEERKTLLKEAYKRRDRAGEPGQPLLEPIHIEILRTVELERIARSRQITEKDRRRQ